MWVTSRRQRWELSKLNCFVTLKVRSKRQQECPLGVQYAKVKQKNREKQSANTKRYQEKWHEHDNLLSHVSYQS